MTISIKLTDATFDNFLFTVPPCLSRAKVFLLPGTDQASSVTNYADLGVPATVIGTPTYGEGYAALTSQSNGFQCGSSRSSPFTHVLVVAYASTGLCGNWTSASATLQPNLVGNSGGTVRVYVDGAQRASQVRAEDSSFAFIAASHDNTTAKIYHRATGGMVTTSGAYGAVGDSPTPFRVGGTGYPDPTVFHVAASLSFDSALTAGEIAELYDYLKYVVAQRGIVVI